MLLQGKIEVFKNKKGYPVAVLKSFSQDGELLGKMFVSCEIRDEKLAEKCVEGKTLTIQVEQGYLNTVHVELEEESFEKILISITKGSVVDVYPKEEKKTTKKSTKKTTNK